MKETLLLLAFSVLLIVSSSILSQPTDKISISAVQSTLLLAKVNTSAIIENNRTLAVQNNKLPDVAEIEYFSEEEAAHLRELFVKAETAVKKNDDLNYFRLSEQLKEYPLLPYLQYQWLKKHIDEEEQVSQFLEQNETSRYARKLKYKWLFHLAKHKKWPLYLQHYSTSSNKDLICYYHRAQFNTGNRQAALDGAKKLWVVGYSQPKVCDPLFSQLKKSDLISQDMIWQRFDAALKNNKVSLAIYVKSLLPTADQSTAQLWLNLHRRPSRHIQELLTQEKTAQSALMFSHAVNRLANKNHTAAIRIWDAHEQDFDVEIKQANKLEKRLALKLALKQEAGAYERLSQLDSPDESSKAWRVRVALTEQNWPNVQSAIDAMDETEKKKEKWQYWSARAYLETGHIEIAEKIFSALSKKRDFYGYLSADKINSMYQLSDNPVHVPAKEIDRLENSKEYRVAYELMKLERTTEAKLQWWHALRQLDKDEIMTAAKLAKRWQWDEIAIFTIAKIKHWDDIDLRFPLSYSDKIHENSEQQKLNPAIVFGLVRRESAFNEKARSPTGARGLMQIMPKTGKQIARDFNERWRGSNSLYNPEKNLKYGSYYYQKLLNKFDGNYALALAAYNAGPHRVKKWLPKDETMPADIWIETIPFHETRDYVTTVLTYALIYQQRMQSTGLSMDEFTRDIQPL